MTQGQVIRSMRVTKGQTQAEVAQVIGLCRTAYCQLENGKRGCKALELAALCELWRVPYSTLFVSKATKLC